MNLSIGSEFEVIVTGFVINLCDGGLVGCTGAPNTIVPVKFALYVQAQILGSSEILIGPESFVTYFDASWYVSKSRFDIQFGIEESYIFTVGS